MLVAILTFETHYSKSARLFCIRPSVSTLNDFIAVKNGRAILLGACATAPHQSRPRSLYGAP